MVKALFLTRSFVLVLSLFLCSCGFKLRGFADIPSWFSQVIVIQKSVDTALAHQVTKLLSTQGIVLVPDIHRAQYLLVLEQDGFQQQMTSVSASTTPRQYQLIYTLHYALLSAQGQTVQPSRIITVRRLLTVNNDRILGSNYEEMTIRHEMLKAASIQLINQIAAIHAH